MIVFLLVLIAVCGASAQTTHDVGTSLADRDGDGLPDAFEQALLERFLPRFHVSRLDCDQMPSTFAPGEAEPRSIAREGVIYGQVSPRPTEAGRTRIELHFFHLWSKDCGRFSHPLDVEHVSALVEGTNLPLPDSNAASASPDAEIWQWRALYWTAAGHQGTVCDVSHAARAELLVAEWTGADVWISSGKHASYLSAKRCRLGCGGDTCPQMYPLTVPRVINVGEVGRPLNGAVWTASLRWPMKKKMNQQFDLSTISQIESSRPDEIVAINRALPPVRATILAGGETLDGVATGGKHTGRALRTGRNSTGSALGRAFRAVKQALGAGNDTAEDASAAEVTKSPTASEKSP